MWTNEHSQVLYSLARRLVEGAAASSDGVDLHAELEAREALPALGLAAESANLDATSIELDGGAQRALFHLLEEIVEDAFLLLEEGIAAGERTPELLAREPLLERNPRGCAALQENVMLALDQREELHRMEALRTLLGLPDLANDGLDVLDRRLRALLPHMALLEPQRQVRAAQLPVELCETHWWYTAAPNAWSSAGEEAWREEEGDAAASDRLGAALAAWTQARIRNTENGSVLQLDRDEARTLLSTEEGRNLSEYLGVRLDLSAAEVPASLLARVLDRLDTVLRGVCEGLLATPTPATTTLVGSTASGPLCSGKPTLYGIEALLSFFPQHSLLWPEVGVLSRGMLRYPTPMGIPVVQPGWLLVPVPDVVSIAPADGAGEARRPGGVRGVIAWLDAKPRCRIRIQRENGAEESVDLPAPEAADGEDAVTLLLRLFIGHRFEALDPTWDALSQELSVDERRAASGLAALIQREVRLGRRRALIRVPVVYRHWSEPSAISSVYLADVVAADARPTGSLISEVEDIGRLCAVADLGLQAERGEWAGEAFLLASRRGCRDERVPGRSSALGLALASLQRYFHLDLACPIIATGALSLTTGGKVTQVDDIREKLDHALATLAAEGQDSAFILAPRDNLAQGGAPVVSADPRYPIYWVDSLAEAANRVFRLPDGTAFTEDELGRIQSGIESLRYDQARAPELFGAARQLVSRARETLADAPRRWVLEYHGLTAAAFALTKIDQDEPLLWLNGAPFTGPELKPEIDASIERVFAAHGPSLPPELRAERLNFAAAATLATAEFDAGLDRVREGLDLPGLVEGQHSEYRKLLGTRAQLRWRRALRYLAHGDRNNAARLAALAEDDIARAWAHAQGDSVDEPNDRARVRAYCCAVRTAAERCGSSTGSDLDHEHWPVLLGPLFDGDTNRPRPAQAPSWGLKELYSRWRVRAEWQRIVEHWRAIAPLPFPFDPLFTVRESLLGDTPRRTLPVDTVIAAILLEAGLRRSDEALVKEAGETRRNSMLGTVRTLAEWWPALEAADADADLDTPAARNVRDLLKTAQAKGVQLSPDRFLEAQLRKLVSGRNDSKSRSEAIARARLLLWHGEPSPGDTPPSPWEDVNWEVLVG